MLGISSLYNFNTVIDNDRILCHRTIPISYPHMLKGPLTCSDAISSNSVDVMLSKIFLILIFTSLFILVGDKLLLSYVSAQVRNGLSANSVNNANVTPHSIGKRSNSTSAGLSANSVNNANVTSHIVGNTTSFRR